MPDYIVSVMARDRVGIVADVANVLRDLGGNVTHLSQTVVRGYFTIMLSVEMPEGIPAARIAAGIEGAAAPGELHASVVPYREGPLPATGASERFVLAILGRDRPGIIARVTTYLAAQRINIEDFSASVVAGDLVLIFTLSVPVGQNITELQDSLEAVGREFGIRATLQHENLFRATSEVRSVAGMITRAQMETGNAYASC
ncbi:MAG: ACT domain-containing protein [Armatimonadota bacterium]|nr:ACT domain-containing protein [Armatimonadota bacterium]